MTLAVISGRMLVAVVLIAAGTAKLADLRSFGPRSPGLGCRFLRSSRRSSPARS